MLKHFLIFPSAPKLTNLLLGRLAEYHALILLRNGLIIHLKTTSSAPPSPLRLSEISATLQEAAQGNYPNTYTVDLLLARHGFAADFVDDSIVDTEAWGVSKCIHAVLISAAISFDAAVVANFKRSLLDEIGLALKREIDAFLLSLCQPAS